MNCQATNCGTFAENLRAWAILIPVVAYHNRLRDNGANYVGFVEALPAIGDITTDDDDATEYRILASGTTMTPFSTTTIKLAVGSSAVNDYYTGCKINLTGGTGAGSYGFVASYDGPTRVATLLSAWSGGVTPDETTTYIIQTMQLTSSAAGKGAGIPPNTDTGWFQRQEGGGGSPTHVGMQT